MPYDEDGEWYYDYDKPEEPWEENEEEEEEDWLGGIYDELVEFAGEDDE